MLNPFTWLFLGLCIFTQKVTGSHNDPINLMQVAGVIKCRNEFDCHLVQDENYLPLNALSAQVDEGFIDLEFAFRGTRIVSFIVTSGEVLVSYGITCSPIVYLDGAHIFCFKAGLPISIEQLAQVPNGLIWFYGIMETDLDH